MYFRYDKPKSPVRVGVIGTGDEGNVLINALNPEYVQVVAIADIRPYSIHRAFHGDWASPDAWELRRGLMAVYGWKTEDEARKHVKVYDRNGGYQDLLKDAERRGVIIALPLHLHAPCACQAMKAGKHVLTEKLMAHNVAQCKVMGRLPRAEAAVWRVGHQRHYSVLYDNAVHLIRWGILGELHHIRAQWHRGNLPGRDSWQQPLPGGEVTFERQARGGQDRPRTEEDARPNCKKHRDQPQGGRTAEEEDRPVGGVGRRTRREGRGLRLRQHERWPTAGPGRRWKNSAAGGSGTARAAA